MKITYDSEADVISIVFKKGKQVDGIEILPEIFLMLDEKENLLEIEIIGASEKVDKQWIDRLLYEIQ